MAAQHLHRYLERPSSGLKELLMKKMEFFGLMPMVILNLSHKTHKPFQSISKSMLGPLLLH